MHFQIDEVFHLEITAIEQFYLYSRNYDKQK